MTSGEKRPLPIKNTELHCREMKIGLVEFNIFGRGLGGLPYEQACEEKLGGRFSALSSMIMDCHDLSEANFNIGNCFPSIEPCDDYNPATWLVDVLNKTRK
jgi:hypothetical protein